MGLVPVQWGDVPTWIAAIFAGGAAWFAYQTIKSQRKQIAEQRQFIAEQSENLALERSELRAVGEDRKWAQARQIHMRQRKAGAVTDGQGNAVGSNHWVVTVQNSSDSPIHDIDVRFGTAYLAAEVYEIPPSAIQGPNPGERRGRPLHLLGPGRLARFLSQRWSAATLHNNRPHLFFTDGNGVRWAIDSYGKLEEASTDGAS
ncbi:hypothetical protein DMH02_006550 [Streptomyces sp. WAC 00631]|uniref:hypothetical protein n=1 Tax=Streptomyces sp. WAC 00631 TaxID=2203201 RepID=UPI000F76BC1C|nr:hypothetical protein [Streptomyces sp. WAC 00631]MCC5032898.1 hypothetical protein [Streptomyces sp. WAC 00631]